MEKYAVCSAVAFARTTANGYPMNFELASGGSHSWANDSPVGLYVSNYAPVQTSVKGPMFGAVPQWKPLVPNADCELPQGMSVAGIVIAMGDGSARMTNSSVSIQTWAQLILPNDGAPLANDW
jgi:hypothetical protein